MMTIDVEDKDGTHVSRAADHGAGFSMQVRFQFPSYDLASLFGSSSRTCTIDEHATQHSRPDDGVLDQTTMAIFSKRRGRTDVTLGGVLEDSRMTTRLRATSRTKSKTTATCVQGGGSRRLEDDHEVKGNLTIMCTTTTGSAVTRPTNKTGSKNTWSSTRIARTSLSTSTWLRATTRSG